MRALIYSDLQATDGWEMCLDNASMPLQRWRVQRFFDKLHEVYNTHECDALFDLGDTTHDRTAIPISTIDLLMLNLRSLSSPNNIKLIGNHEQVMRHPDIHSGAMYQGIFTVVHMVTTIQVDDVAFICASYDEDTQRLSESLKKAIDAAKSSGLKVVVLGHFSVDGSAAHGENVGGLTRSLFEDADVVLLGHIHKHQKIGTNIWHVGSPFQQNFGEASEKKFMAILDTGDLSVEWIPVDGMPIYRTVDLQGFLRHAPTSSPEDRFKVLLHTAAEASQFYGCDQARKGVPEFVQTDETKTHGENAPESITNDFNSLLTKWVDTHEKECEFLGIAEDDMLACGLELSGRQED